jgi:hypothetical protein
MPDPIALLRKHVIPLDLELWSRHDIDLPEAWPTGV